jgi:hypothetical protein
MCPTREMHMRDPVQGGTPIGGFFDDFVSSAKGVYGAAKGAASAVSPFGHHSPGWFTAAMPLLTRENHRYLAGKLGDSTGEHLHDVGVKAVAHKALGPQGPALVETYNKVTEDAARGNRHAREILSHAPQIVKLATASRQGPEAFKAAITATNSAVKVSGDYQVGGPWLDIEEDSYAIDGPWLDIADPDPSWGYTVGGPWLDLVGSQVDGHQAWPQTRALIQSAINEVHDMASWRPAGAYVWSLDPPSASPSPHLTLEGVTSIESFGTPAEALEYMRQRIQTPHVALAIFDRRSPHWPHPTNWTKSDDPAYEPVIAQQIEKGSPARTAGSYVGADWQSRCPSYVVGADWQSRCPSYVGADPRRADIGAALDDVRARARSIAGKRAGRVIGVIHSTQDGLWHALAFHDGDAADDWLGLATQVPADYTYAAYYDKEDFQWPHPVNEKIGGPRGARGRTAAGTRWVA